MATTFTRTTLLFCTILLANLSYSQKFGFQEVLEKQPNTQTVFCVPNNDSNLNLLEQEAVKVKFSSKSWLFINATPAWIDEHIKDGSLDDYYFEYAPPTMLSDTALLHHRVLDVHTGTLPLESSYTGKDVIIGIVDQGLDWTHPDFIDSNGNTRVLRYWDHSFNGPNPPAPFTYGQEWDSTEINNGSCTSTEGGTAHGTTVAGLAAGNAMANGTNLGHAPDANIIIVETNFNLPNWTLTVADAVDYIFQVADSYGMPAVVNLSLGSYLGSHDGNDPASEYIETLLDEKGGRIVVCAAGNAGAKGKYHQQHTVSPTDTNFVWFKNNPSAAIAPNTIFFDIWTDNSNSGFNFALGADTPGPDYDFRGRTDFHIASSGFASPTFDTIWNGTNRIATVEIYRETVGSNFHLQVLFRDVDSTDYLYRFETIGTGQYDLWSGSWLGYNDMETVLPTVVEMPHIVNYVMPDSMQTIVSSWNCSEKVISVGNMKNRQGFINNNNDPWVSGHPNAVGEVSPNSSKGPTRHNIIKPDVIGAGDHTLSAGPLWLLSNPAWNLAIDSGGWHVLNGGTSMASPGVAGIAALYLERCGMANWQTFKEDLINTAYTDAFTGTIPNNAYGYGKPDAFELLQELNLIPQPLISWSSGPTLSSSSGDAYQWYLDGVPIIGETNQDHLPSPPYGSYEVLVISSDGCSALSEPFTTSASLNQIGIENIKVFPNPSVTQITIDTDETILELTLIDMNGKKLELNNLGNNTYDLSNLVRGGYTLIITTERGTVRSKIVHL